MFPSTPNRVRPVRWLLGSLAFLFVLTAGVGRATAAEDLDRKLRDSADRIIKKLREKNCKSVGVLTFGVQKPNEGTRYNLGLINQNLADRVEIALLLANDQNDPLNILTKASSVAKDNLQPGVNHLSAQGRQKLMALSYPRAWRERGQVAKFQPDVLLTGVAKISPYPKQTVVSIEAITRDAVDQKPTLIETFTVDTDIRTMVESGGSYVATRGFWDKGALHYQELAFNSNDDKGYHPVAKASSGYVRLTVYYDDVAILCDEAALRAGTASIPEPRAGQKVHFVIERADPADRRTYGIVLKVNGENTFFKQHEEPIHCAKWLLTPNWHKTKITGYQLDNKQMEEFVVQGEAESRANELRYGEHVGQISLVVYAAETEVREKVPPAAIVFGDAAIRESEVKAVGHGELPPGQFGSLLEFQQELRAQAEAATSSGEARGLIGGGAVGVKLVDFVEFKPHPTPVMIGTINYYKPRGR